MAFFDFLIHELLLIWGIVFQGKILFAQTYVRTSPICDAKPVYFSLKKLEKTPKKFIELIKGASLFLLEFSFCQLFHLILGKNLYEPIRSNIQFAYLN